MGYIYRDLKPENILIDFNGNAKLCDFGYATKHQSGDFHTEICGSYEYIPPEMLTKEGYNHSYDLYCLGLLFLELLTGCNPFKGITPKNLDEIHNRKINFDIPSVSHETITLLHSLL
jgi:serine/threonine protein kinase